MSTTPLGVSGQGGGLFLAGQDFQCTIMRLRKSYHNADTTVEDSGWSQLCPIYRDWFVDIEIPFAVATAGWDSTGISEVFDDSDYGDDDPTGQDVQFELPNGITYDGTGCLDGDYEVIDDAKDAVRVRFTIKGTGPLTKSGG